MGLGLFFDGCHSHSARGSVRVETCRAYWLFFGHEEATCKKKSAPRQEWRPVQMSQAIPEQHLSLPASAPTEKDGFTIVRARRASAGTQVSAGNQTVVPELPVLKPLTVLDTQEQVIEPVAPTVVGEPPTPHG